MTMTLYVCSQYTPCKLQMIQSCFGVRSRTHYINQIK